MRLVFTLGRMTIFDFTLFNIEDPVVTEEPDVVVVHHYNDNEDDDKKDGPEEDLFGKG